MFFHIVFFLITLQISTFFFIYASFFYVLTLL
nr:MAG TPA: hypothetical protein [Microviridae sp.]DAO91577.1 MAG TPA: hypothetical protein [Microviridae sp.]